MRPPTTLPTTLLVALMLVAGLATSVAVAQQAASDTTDLIAQARKQMSAGQLDEALATYRRALEAKPGQWDAHYGMGLVLDLKGDYSQAREHLAKAIDLAPETNKAQAISAMGVSYAFESKPQDAARFYQQLFDQRIAAASRPSAGQPAGTAGGAPPVPPFVAAGETANALARIYLESGDVDSALKWYRTGYDTARRQPDLSGPQADLAEMRWHNAQARIDARRGRFDSARKHIAEAQKFQDKGTNPEQAPYMPYLKGYVAFHAGQFDGAIAELRQADQQDPFVLILLAQALERKGQKGEADEIYRKVLSINGHNINNAFARPIARKKVS